MRSRYSPLALTLLFPFLGLSLLPGCFWQNGSSGGGSHATTFETEPNDGTLQANSLVLGTPIQGDVSFVGDQDWFIVRLNQGRTVQVELFATRLDQAGWEAAGTVPRLTVYFPDETSKLFEHSFASGWTGGPQDFDIPSFQVAQTGGYWFVVSSDNDLVAGAGYVIRVTYASPIPNQTEFEKQQQQGVDDTPGTAQALSPGMLYGFHRQGNSDYYAVTVSGPRVLRFELLSMRDGAVAGATTVYDPLLNLYGVDGSTLLRTNDDAFFQDPAIQYQVQGPGTYFLQVTQDPASTVSGFYLLNFASDATTAISEVEPNNTPLGADGIAYGQNLSGSIAPGTEDWFQFAGTAGDMVRVQVFDKNISQSASEALNVTLVASDGTTPIPFNEGPGFQVLSTILQQTGTCYIRTRPGGGAVASTNYRLELRKFHAATYESEPNDTVATADTFPSGGYAAGVIATAGDQDLFHFTTSTGELVTFDVFAGISGNNGFPEYSGFGSDLPPLLTIRDTTGAVVARSTSQPPGATFAQGISDGLPTAAVTFVGPPTSHTFYVDVTAADGSGGPNHYYVVHRR